MNLCSYFCACFSPDFWLPSQLSFDGDTYALDTSTAYLTMTSSMCGLAVVVYITANVSGGHLNPAVTFATCLTGHTSWAKGALYVVAQVLGGVFGSLMGVSHSSSFWQCRLLSALDPAQIVCNTLE